jgi:murein DD-endopeptidase MepM/ murein hydrolase activator NlpD
MAEKVKRRLFSLMIVPDSGSNVKSGNFTMRFLPWIIGTLSVLFTVCLFFIIGYHIKLNQEKNFKNALTEHRRLLSMVEKSEKSLDSLLNKMNQLQRYDQAFRNFEGMKPVDYEMYKAGVGGHMIVDYDELAPYDDDLKQRIAKIEQEFVSLESRTDIQKKSFSEIETTNKANRINLDGTPTIYPVYGHITSRFGPRMHPIFHRRIRHEGVDIRGRRGQQIKSTADGTVRFAGWKGGYGRTVIIRQKLGYETTYGHLHEIRVRAGMAVKKGKTVIGTMGSTGYSTGTHLHYEISKNGRPIDPVRFLLDQN